MSLTDAELDRYARHIVLKEVGGAGQRAIRAAHVVVCGAGGIGSPAIQYLTAAGIGKLTVIDRDVVELSNLQRQTIFMPTDIGSPKVEAAYRWADAQGGVTTLVSLNADIQRETFADAISDADAVVDGTDSFATRLFIADACLETRIPLISAAVAQFEGQLATYRGWEADKPCYRCLVGSATDRPEDSCAEAGVLGPMAGVMGSLAALEVLREIVKFGDDSAGKLMIFDGLSLRARTVILPKDPGCPACGG